ncbi:CHASE2 domain-containing protein [Pararobbsia silviterrae]|uniref:CHASE2 domain-containing protein n=1 Tax=Pararobbsia silviterrae TaxID=1792498 RepID=UPI001314A004|nr:CHASE2 domain-containing protein [Pararobbsia silviterrae]
MRPRWVRRWLINIVIGGLIELLIHFAGHTLEFGPIVAFENWGLDTINRMTVSLCDSTRACSTRVPEFKPPVLIDIDEQTWRSAAWDGGEPDRAPRRPLFTLIDRAFAAGAAQVVLDVAIEDRNIRDDAPGASADRRRINAADDNDFANALETLLAKPYFEHGKRLILVRGERTPLPGDDAAFLPEQKQAREVDKVIRQSGGRIVAAAPYFEVASDRILRDWDLFRVVCDRPAGTGAEGQARVVPSVQLLTAATFFNVDQAAVDPGAVGSCLPFPAQGESGFDTYELEGRTHYLQAQLGRDEHAIQACASSHTEHECEGIERRYWSDVQAAFAQRQVRLGGLPHEEGVSNRIIFRYTPDRVDTIPARTVLGAPPEDNALLKDVVDGRIVVIGQTFAEAGDVYPTPLGRMPGAVVLVNAIDSMAQQRFLSPPSRWLVFLATFLTVVAVGFISARTQWALTTTAATLFVIATSGIGSFVLFSHGVWLDFSAPIIGIQVERWIESIKERIELHRFEKLHAESGEHH